MYPIIELKILLVQKLNKKFAIEDIILPSGRFFERDKGKSNQLAEEKITWIYQNVSTLKER